MELGDDGRERALAAIAAFRQTLDKSALEGALGGD